MLIIRRALMLLLLWFASILAWAAAGGDVAEAAMLERLAAEGVLRVCIWPDYYGITFRDPRSGELSGIDIDLAQEFAQDLRLKTRFVESGFPRFAEDLSAGRCDIAMFGVGVTAARASLVRFTAPYLRSDVVAVLMKDNSPVTTWDEIDRSGRVVAVQAGTYMEDVMRSRLTQAELLVIKTPDSREDALLSGRSDVFISDVPYARRVVDLMAWAALLYAPYPVAPVDYAYAVAPGDPAWLERADRFVASIKADGRLRHAAHRNRLDSIALCD
jgi:ABC-type amino acid transport substrate-binding protein